MAKKIIYAIIWLFLFIFIIGWFYTVSPWERAFTVTFGKIWDKVHKDWLHFKNPFITKVVKFDIQTQKLEAEAAASSNDMQIVSSVVVLNYAFEESAIIELYKTIGNKTTIENKIINPSVQEVIKAVTATYNAEWLISKRSEVSSDILANLKERLTDRGIIVQAFNIINFDFSQSFNEAIERKVTAEQDALAQKNKLEQVKYEAEQRITQARAEAEAIKIQAQAITQQGGSNYVSMKRVEKWNWVLPQYVLWANTNLYMPIGQ
jgi:regulator of protease activity HflC (stomatin/prohibitin superfamily)